jgi:hypothetical protein
MNDDPLLKLKKVVSETKIVLSVDDTNSTFAVDKMGKKLNKSVE